MRWRPYPAYKDSGIEWLGNVPEHWEVLRIKRLTMVKRGASPRPIDDPRYFNEDGEYSWVRIADVTASERYLQRTTQHLSELGKSLSVPLELGDIFLSIAGSVGKPIITKIKCCIHDGFVYFPGYDGDKEFLYYIFASGQPYLGLGKLGTQLNLNTDTVGDIHIGWPPSGEQRAIVAFLDRETAKIDALIAKKQRLIELLQEKRAALISHAVTKGLDPSVPMKDTGVEWLGEIPAHWSGTALKRWVEVKITDGPHETPEFADEGVPFVSAEAVRNGRIDFDSKRGYITPELHARYVRKVHPQRDDIFIVKSGATTGKLAKVDIDFEFSVWSPLALIRADLEKTPPEFLFLALHADYVQNQVQRTWSAGTQPNISMAAIERLYVVAPPLPEQRAIAALLDRETAKIDTLISKVQDAIDRLSEYRTALISAAVTGKIDVREAVP